VTKQPSSISKLKKRLFLILISTLLVWACPLLSAQEIQPRGLHPRLFFTPGQIANLQEHISTSQGTSRQRNP
jgi:hypothetical protein